MRLLLDSHVLIWTVSDAARLSPDTRSAIADPNNAVCVSAASVWEIEIKRASGKFRFDVDLVAELSASGFEPLAIEPTHGVAAARLPLHHRDPFDRMLVAQAQAEGLTIVTRDPRIAEYDVRVMRA